MNLRDLLLAVESSNMLSSEEKQKFQMIFKSVVPERSWPLLRDEWLAAKMARGGKNAAKTRRNNKNYLRFFETFWLKKYGTEPDLNSIDYRMAINYLSWLKEQHKSTGELYDINYLYRVYISLLSFLKYAEVPGVERMKSLIPKKVQKNLKIYDSEEIRIIFNMYGKAPFEEFMKRINMHLRIVTGARSVEIDNLKWKDIDWKESGLNVVLKGGREGWKYVPRAIMEELGEYRALHEELMTFRDSQGLKTTDRLFFIVRHDGEIRTPSESYFASMLKKRISDWNLTHSMKIPYKGTHAIRKHFLNVVKDSGADFSIAATLADHKNVQTTKEFYLLVSKKDKKEYYEKYALEELEELMEGAHD